MFEEPLFTERSESAKLLAERILSNRIESEDEMFLSLSLILSRHYNIPLFSEYFIDRTLDELLLEIELIRQSSTPPEQRTSDVLKKASSEEIDQMFPDLPMSGQMPTPPMNPEENRFMKDALEFMENGNFKGDGNAKE